MKAGFQGPAEAEHPRPESIGTKVDETQGFVSYTDVLKIFDRNQLEPYKNRVPKLARRFSKLSGEEGTQEYTNS